MKLSDFRSKFSFKALSTVLGDAKHKGIWNKPSWVTQMSHGHYVIEYQPSERGFYVEGSVSLDLDSILVQREQISNLDLWLFGVCDNEELRNGISGYLESHLFDKKPKEVITKCKETMRKAYLNAREKCKDAIKEGDKKVNVSSSSGSTSVMVINGNKVVITAMGEYRVVMCRDGIATEIRASTSSHGKRRRPHKAILGLLHMPRLRIQARKFMKYRITTRSWRNLEIAISSQRVDSDTEMIILGSPGVWEVMNNEEAISLIGHIEDAEKAAECLAREAMARNSRRNISCLIIKFD